MLYTKSLVFLSAIGQVLAQRPSGTSICDYYTQALFGDTKAADEYTLLTVLVNTVVIGNYTPCAVGGSVPGILAPASYGGEQVNLLPYFNGCLRSTNVDGHPASVNFLDGGGAAPLMKNMPANDASSNQYGLLTHLYQFFGALVGCSGYGMSGFPSYQGDPGMASVHKFMALDANEVGYFISQVGAAAVCLGVSTADATYVGGALQMYFGYRCSPYTDIGIGGPQLESICEDCSCPLDPNANCNLYDHGGCYPDPKVAPQCASMPATMSTTNKYSKTYSKTYSKSYSKSYSKTTSTTTSSYHKETKSWT